MGKGRIDSEKVRQMIKDLERELYPKRNAWQRFIKWLTNW
jgi:hypothetical protein